MRTIRAFLAFPAFALAATFSGTLVDLSGVPIGGAVVKTSVDSTITTGGGAWSLARTLSVTRRDAKPVSVTSHLVVENGRPRLSYGGADASGHRSSPGSVYATSLQTPAARMTAAVGTDTLKLYWKGKRLVVLPVAATDSTGIVLRIDTAWGDDANIPWNPAIAYGSIPDTRDGRTYRTVVIGTQTWMAENLNYSGTGNAIGHCYEDFIINCLSMGRLYSWAEAMGLDTSFNSKFWLGTSFQGVCPSGWHVPSNPEWLMLIPEDVSSDTVENGVPMHFGYNLTAGKRLKATSGWTGPGQDQDGMRIVQSGMMATGAAGTRWLQGGAYFRVATENPSYSTGTWYQSFQYSTDISISMNISFKPGGLSLRCLQD